MQPSVFVDTIRDPSSSNHTLALHARFCSRRWALSHALSLSNLAISHDIIPTSFRPPRLCRLNSPTTCRRPPAADITCLRVGIPERASRSTPRPSSTSCTTSLDRPSDRSHPSPPTAFDTRLAVTRRDDTAITPTQQSRIYGCVSPALFLAIGRQVKKQLVRSPPPVDSTTRPIATSAHLTLTIRAATALAT